MGRRRLNGSTEPKDTSLVQHEYYMAHKDLYKEALRRFLKEHPDYFHDYQKEHRVELSGKQVRRYRVDDEFRERKKEYNRRWRMAHPDYNKQYYHANKNK